MLGISGMDYPRIFRRSLRKNSISTIHNLILPNPWPIDYLDEVANFYFKRNKFPQRLGHLPPAVNQEEESDEDDSDYDSYDDSSDDKDS